MNLPALPALRPDPVAAAAEWSLPVLQGRLVELSQARSGAALSLAVGLALDAQRRGEPVAWIGSMRSGFYPPDAAECGLDLDALLVVRLPEGERASGVAIARAADHLVRSGAFGLLVLDLGALPLPAAAVSRLLALAQRHDTALLCLTEKPASAPSLGALISLRAEATRRRSGDGGFTCTLEVHKDKRRAPGWGHVEVRRGPSGLR